MVRWLRCCASNAGGTSLIPGQWTKSPHIAQCGKKKYIGKKERKKNKNEKPGTSDSERIHLQCRRPGFDPWVRKIPWRRDWQPTAVFLPGESHGQRSLVGYSPWGRKEWDRTERLSLLLSQPAQHRDTGR